MTCLTLDAGPANLTEGFLGYPQSRQINVRFFSELKQKPLPSLVFIIRIHPTVNTQD